MNVTHIHLVLTHGPIFLVLIGVAVLVAAVLRRSAELRWTSYTLFALGALTAIPVYLSGEGSGDALEHVAGVSESIIDAHAASAKISLIGVELLGLAAAALAVLERTRRGLLAPLTALLVVVGSLTSISLAYTANLGGQIRHPEIGNGFGVNQRVDRGASERGDARAAVTPSSRPDRD